MHVGIKIFICRIFDHYRKEDIAIAIYGIKMKRIAIIAAYLYGGGAERAAGLLSKYLNVIEVILSQMRKMKAKTIALEKSFKYYL